MTAWRDGRLMASLYKGAAPPSDRPALFPDLILGASSKGRRQLQAQQEHEQEAGARPSRLPARLDGSPSSCSCSCCAWIWRLRFELLSKLMSGNNAGRSVGGAAPLHRVTIRRPSLLRRHHAGPRVLNRVHDARGSRARPARGLSIFHLIRSGHQRFLKNCKYDPHETS